MSAIERLRNVAVVVAVVRFLAMVPRRVLVALSSTFRERCRSSHHRCTRGKHAQAHVQRERLVHVPELKVQVGSKQ